MVVELTGESVLIGGRYRLLNQLGAGGMGKVYRVHDRLTGETVALKQVSAPAEADLTTPLPTPSNYHITMDPRVTLAREFQAMATLRHPHILAVLDYGFQEGTPYFTMELLEDAQTFLQYAQQQPLERQIELLVEVLRALMYIHRRDMIHRDLKPGNVLVSNDQVKVLDFGLSTEIAQATGTVGTLAYMPPEVLYGDPAGPSADLYSLGVMVYELLTGRHPFFDNLKAGHSALQQLLNPEHQPDLSLLPPPLVPIIGQMLERDARKRYQDAAQVVADLGEATSRHFAVETRATRESFLQAARFVGREHELGQLKNALVQAMGGRGSAWLIGGESGVGKSRLVDELRTLALVRGALVLRSAAAMSGGGPFLVWRDILRWLVLVTEVSDLEASILRPLVPDIDQILDRPVPPTPTTLNPADARTRLFSTVADLLRRQTSPVVIILEDLQWETAESLQLLEWLNRIVANRPVMLVGNYRDDERPDLPEQLVGMRLLPLRRLEEREVARLSESMLGPSGRDQEVLALLLRETEGNPFFLVEVARALAEEVGRLDRIGSRSLPSRVVTGGLAQLIQRRLDQVPEEGRPLLQAAAIAGRRLDLRVLQALAPEIELQRWLDTCANAAVLDVQDDRWRFAHDKLREGVLASLPDDLCRRLHEQVALAIEQVHGQVSEAAQLAYHWATAGNREREKYFSALAGREALRSGANHDAVLLLERALALEEADGPPRDEEARLWRAQITRRLGQAFLGLGRMVESQRYLEKSLAIARRPVPRGNVRLGLGLLRQLSLQTGHRLRPSYFVGLAGGHETPLLMEAVRANQQIAEVYYFASQRARLINAGLNTLNISEWIGPCNELARAYGNMTIIAGLIPLERLAETYARLAIETAEAIDDLPAMAWAYVTSSVYTAGRGQWERTLQLSDRALELCRQTADKRTLGLGLGARSLVPYHRGAFESCIRINQQWEENAANIDNLQHQIFGLTGQGECLMRLGRLDEAEARLEASGRLWADREVEIVELAALFRETGVWALLRWRQGRTEEAMRLANQAMTLVSHASSASQAIIGDGVAGVAETYLSLWEQRPSMMTEADRKNAEQVCRILGSYARAFIIWQPRTLLLQGWHEWLRGKTKQAQRKWQRGLAIARQLVMPYDEALLAYRLSTVSADTAEREQLRQQATSLLQSLGTVYDWELVQGAYY